MKEIKITIQKNGQVQMNSDTFDLNELYSVIAFLEVEAVDRYIAKQILRDKEEITIEAIRKRFNLAFIEVNMEISEYFKRHYEHVKRSIVKR